MRCVFILLPVLFLSACVSTSVNDFFTVETAPSGTTGASNAGNYPDLTSTPSGATSQLTDAQVAQEKQQLAAAAGKGRSQASANNQAAYNAEVARLRRLAEDQKRRRAESVKAVSQ